MYCWKFEIAHTHTHTHKVEYIPRLFSIDLRQILLSTLMYDIQTFKSTTHIYIRHLKNVFVIVEWTRLIQWTFTPNRSRGKANCQQILLTLDEVSWVHVPLISYGHTLHSPLPLIHQSVGLLEGPYSVGSSDPVPTTALYTTTTIHFWTSSI